MNSDFHHICVSNRLPSKTDASDLTGPDTMLYSILYLLGGFLVLGLGVLTCLAMVFAVPGNSPKTETEKRALKRVEFLILATPIWVLVFVIGYFNDTWGLPAWPTRLIFILLTPVPLAAMALNLSLGARNRK